MVFEAPCPSSISRIKCGQFRPPWHGRPKIPGLLVPDVDIIGAGFDGTIYQLTIVTDKALRLLRFLENLYLKENKYNAPDLVQTRLNESPPQARAIDGNVLKIVLDLGQSWLKMRLQESKNDEQMLEEMMRALFDASSVSAVETVLSYLKNLLDCVVL